MFDLFRPFSVKFSRAARCPMMTDLLGLDSLHPARRTVNFVPIRMDWGRIAVDLWRQRGNGAHSK